MLNDAEVMIEIIKWMISEASNMEYIHKLEIMLERLKGKKHIEEFDNPRYLSIVMFGSNLFPYNMSDYREMVKILITKV